jgi:hypothetical protein
MSTTNWLGNVNGSATGMRTRHANAIRNPAVGRK